MDKISAVSAAVVGAVVIFAVSVSPATAHHSNSRRWSGTPAEVVVVDRTGDAEWNQATQHAVEVWNRAGSNLHLRWASGSGECGFEDHTINVCIGYADGAQGAAWYGWGPDGYITGARVTFDEKKMEGASAWARRAMACHEIGHTLVLDHTDDEQSCMSAHVKVDTPNSHDYGSLLETYGEWSADTTSTTASPTTTTTTPEDTAWSAPESPGFTTPTTGPTATTETESPTTTTPPEDTSSGSASPDTTTTTTSPATTTTTTSPATTTTTTSPATTTTTTSPATTTTTTSPTTTSTPSETTPHTTVSSGKVIHTDTATAPVAERQSTETSPQAGPTTTTTTVSRTTTAFPPSEASTAKSNRCRARKCRPKG